MNTSDFKGIVSENKWILVTGTPANKRGLLLNTVQALPLTNHALLEHRSERHAFLALPTAPKS